MLVLVETDWLQACDAVPLVLVETDLLKLLDAEVLALG